MCWILCICEKKERAEGRVEEESPEGTGSHVVPCSIPGTAKPLGPSDKLT